MKVHSETDEDALINWYSARGEFAVVKVHNILEGYVKLFDR